MEKVFLSRRNLETMSTADLISLADDYGIDIPGSLNRSFIIGELLAFSDELEREQETTVLLSDGEESSVDTLPSSYNETAIRVLARNPAWAFVYWDFKESDIESIQDDFLEDSIFLRVRYFSTMDGEKPADSFDIQVPLSDRERYVLISRREKFFDVELTIHTEEGCVKSLAVSNRVEASPECSDAVLAQPGSEISMSELTRLSGMEKLLHNHYVNHRQAF